ncbi:MAG: D-alanyl-D-alanine carboxypeptidase/D-alanyl-D-alanine-endopeptidase [Myxococcales bacterium]|nr:D-alanyl-D-alanine carboxypeptidase/D-alanyl-D-alanine-endopeptidase [Myxococcales bacterium]
MPRVTLGSPRGRRTLARRVALASLLAAAPLSLWALVGVDGPPQASAAAPAKAPAPAASLAADLEAMINDARWLSGSKVGVVVLDLESGARLYERNPKVPLNPASNIKVVTTVAALGLLGPEARFGTEVYAAKDAVRGDAVQGDLYLIGGGDPGLVTEDLYNLAGDLRDQGIRKITGRVIVDSGYFDGDGLPPGFDQKDEFARYRTPASAASVNFNTFVVKMRPAAQVGGAATHTVVPPVPMIKATTDVKTVAGRSDKVEVAHEVKDGALHLTFTGTIGVDHGTSSYRYPISDAARYTGELLALVLEQQGIKLAKHDVKLGAKPRGAEQLAIVRSAPLSVLIRSVNKLSNNYMAEQILRLVDTADEDGLPASYAGALAKVRAYLEGASVDLTGFTMTNGSGLYDTNRITAEQLTRVLALAHDDFRVAADFLASLPIAGAEGTLRRRMDEGAAARWVRAKTGTLDGVSSLSGYAGAPGRRRPIAFTILVNGFDSWKIGKVRRLQDAIAERIAAEAAGVPAAP